MSFSADRPFSFLLDPTDRSIDFSGIDDSSNKLLDQTHAPLGIYFPPRGRSPLPCLVLPCHALPCLVTPCFAPFFLFRAEPTYTFFFRFDVNGQSRAVTFAFAFFFTFSSGFLFLILFLLLL